MGLTVQGKGLRVQRCAASGLRLKALGGLRLGLGSRV